MTDHDRAIPTLPSRSIAATTAFFRALGFDGGAHPFSRDYAVFTRGTLELHFFTHRELVPAASSAGCYLRVHDVDRLHRDFARAGLPGEGIPRLERPEDKPWGLREFALVDPDGNLLRIGQRLPPRPPASVTAESAGFAGIDAALRIEPLADATDPDWLALRRGLWPEPSDAEQLGEMAEFVESPDRFAQFIARAADGRGIGLAEASIRTDYVPGTESSPVGYLEGLYVEADQRRQGVARQLVDAVAAWAVAKGCVELASDTWLENVVSQAVHERLGFVETERAVFYCRSLAAREDGA
jgi:aminoglycoside 6'-N-acetyltransferase I